MWKPFSEKAYILIHPLIHPIKGNTEKDNMEMDARNLTGEYLKIDFIDVRKFRS